VVQLRSQRGGQGAYGALVAFAHQSAHRSLVHENAAEGHDEH
jgi:hypothetical protein